MMPGSASGVWRAALWKRTMEPGCTRDVTRSVISPAESSFQSRLSPSQTASRRWGGPVAGFNPPRRRTAPAPGSGGTGRGGPPRPPPTGAPGRSTPPRRGSGCGTGSRRGDPPGWGCLLPAELRAERVCSSASCDCGRTATAECPPHPSIYKKKAKPQGEHSAADVRTPE